MELISDRHPLVVVVGSGGVGKTTLAASMGVLSARAGRDTLVMTFDPSLRLKDALGVGEEAKLQEIPVPLDAPGKLYASLLDARQTFDRLIQRYAAEEEASRRILENRFYQQLSGTLSGILEYMAVERLFEVEAEGRYSQVILDTPPTRQALDFLEAPQRIIGFLESGAIRVALKPWFDEEGRLKAASRFGPLGRQAERFLDDVVGLDLLRDMAEFFQAFAPLYEGFRERAQAVEQLLRSPKTRFVLVSGPGEERIPDTLFFARKLEQAGFHLGPILVNRVHPHYPVENAPAAGGWELLSWLGERDRKGLVELAKLVGREQPLIDIPLLPEEPTDLASLESLGKTVQERLAGWAGVVRP
ncbi:MAG TPA: ArsA-related P-loop ATPase [Thermoanaerobaculia bacterium]|jgi:anion-transporting  ArsA/GET3 family ATPase|nr:ArsA-related P-loop ATPase [Thermoanaerobaculia bacterium]